MTQGTPQVALDLSQDGITLLSRAPDGAGWWREGGVRLDDPALPDALARLRDKAERRHGPDFASILLMPESQLLLTVLERDDRPPQATIRAALEGRTPYAVEDLAFDWLERGDRLHVAVVAIETLLEAETFAVEHGLRPAGFAATITDAAFPGTARFGPTGTAETFLGGPLKMDLAQTPMVVVPAPPLPEPEPAPLVAEPEAEAEAPPPEEAPSADAGSVDTEAREAATPEPAPSETPVPEERAEAPAAEPEDAPDPVAAPEPEADPQPEADPEPEAAAAPLDPAPAPPVPPSPPAKAALTATRDPGFASRRRKTAPPEAPRGDGPSRLRPRLTTGRPAPDDRSPDGPSPAAPLSVGPSPAAPTPGPAPAAKPARAEPTLGARTPKPKPKAEAVPTLATASAALAAPPRGAPVLPPPRPIADTAPADEAEALSLPGYARERAAAKRAGAAPKRGKLGLWLTLGLLALLALVALWSLVAPGGPVARLWTADAPVLAVAEPEPAPDPVPAATDAPVADIAALPERATGSAVGSETIAPPAPLALTAPDAPDAEPDAEIVVAAADPAILRSDSVPDLDPEAAIRAPDPLGSEPETGTETGAETGTDDALAPEPEAVEANPAPDGPPVPQESPADLYVASIDPAVLQGDAVALPPAPALDPAFKAPRAATAPATLPDATPGGVVTEAGYTVVAGRPGVMPAPRPGTSEDATVETAEAGEGDPELAAAEAARRAELRRIAPRPRPLDAAERVERAANGGLLRAELARAKPRPRPESAQAVAAAVQAAAAAASAGLDAQAAEAARRAAEADSAAEAEAIEAARRAAAAASVSRLAIPRSERPDSRPRSVERAAARFVQRRQESREQAPAAQTASRSNQTLRQGPTSVARAATERNVLRLNQINLIGVYGKPSARRALVRLSNGRYVKVEVGDRLDRGRVIAIGDRELSYRRGGRNVVLRLPRA